MGLQQISLPAPIPVPDTFPALFWAYAFIWALLGIYIISLGIRLARIEKKVSEEHDRN